MLHFILIALVAYGAYRLLTTLSPTTKKCPRCEGKGWWQNTRNREKCEWCGGTGKVAKDFPLRKGD